jgi:hypothetical protein
MNPEQKQLLRRAYILGFKFSGEGGNYEYPYCNGAKGEPEDEEYFCNQMEVNLAGLLNEGPPPLLKNPEARKALQKLFELEYNADEVREAMMQLDIEESA